MVSIQDFEKQISSSNPHRLRIRMNIYSFDVFTNHCIAVEDIDEVDRIGFYLHHVEIGPLNLPQASHLKIVKEAVWNISTLSIASNCLTGFSSWEDYFKLPIHSVVME